MAGGDGGRRGTRNLRGANWALDHAPCPVEALIAIEGNYLGKIGTKAVGSVRWNVEVSGPGGHAWEAASAPSAIDVAARMVASLGDVPVEQGLRSVNVGMFTGGEAVNARAQRASFLIDMRAVDPIDLDQLEADCRSIVLAPLAEGVAVAIHEIGRRPAGSIDAQHPLVRVARQTLELHGLTSVMIASSTDANAAHPRGIPAVALGITFGEGEHTSEEWIDIEFIATGLRALRDTVIAYVSEVDNDAHYSPVTRGVILQPVDAPGDFVPMVSEIESLGYANLWLLIVTARAQRVLVPDVGGDEHDVASFGHGGDEPVDASSSDHRLRCRNH